MIEFALGILMGMGTVCAAVYLVWSARERAPARRGVAYRVGEIVGAESTGSRRETAREYRVISQKGGSNE